MFIIYEYDRDKNTAIGHSADVSSDNLINATAIGYNAKVGSSNTIKLGNSSIDSVVTSGKLKLGNIIFPNTDSTAGLFLTTNGSGNISWVNASPLTSAVSATTTNTNIFDLNNTETSYNDMNVYSANNIRIGNDALKSVTTGIANTALGDSAMIATNQGSANVALGYKSMFKNQIGNVNTAVGTYSLYENTLGSANSAFGNLALSSNTTGDLNSAFGEWALKSNTTGNRNTAMGANALRENTIGINNTASGRASLQNNTEGNNNTSFGFQALIGNTIGSNNTAFGYQSNVNANNLTNATAIGYRAIVNASNKIQLGNSDVQNVATAGTFTAGSVTYPNTHNSISGQVLTVDAAGSATWSTTTTSIELTGDITGSGSGTFTTTIADNAVTASKISSNGITPGYVLTATASGTTSWEEVSGVSSVGAVETATSTGATISSGVLSLSPADETNPGIISTSTQTFAGAKTFNSNLNVNGTISTQNINISSSYIALGPSAGLYGGQQPNSIAIGTEAAFSENAPYAIAIGYRAGFRLQYQNAIAIGKEAGREDQFPNAISIGSDAGYIGQHDNSVAIGKGAGNKFQWTNAIAIGTGAGIDLSANPIEEDKGQAADAIAIGTEAGNQNQGQNAIAIGKGAGKLDQADNSIILNASGSSLNAGNSGFYVNPIRSGSNGSGINHLYYDATTREVKYSTTGIAVAYDDIKANSILTGSLAMTSDRRLKTNISSLTKTLDIITKLNPVSYKKKDSIASAEYSHDEMGFIAQEIQKVLPQVVVEGKDKDKILSVNYISLIPVLTKAIQEQQQQIEEQKISNNDLKNQMDRQQKEIDELKALIKSIKK